MPEVSPLWQSFPYVQSCRSRELPNIKKTTTHLNKEKTAAPMIDWKSETLLGSRQYIHLLNSDAALKGREEEMGKKEERKRMVEGSSHS